MRILRSYLIAISLFFLPIIANGEITINYPNIVNDKPLCYEKYDLVFIADESFINNSIYCANSIKISSPHIKQGILCWKVKLTINEAERPHNNEENQGPWFGAADCNALCTKHCT